MMTRARARYVHEQERINSLLDLYIHNAIELDHAVRQKTKLQRSQQDTVTTPPKELYLGAGATRKIASSRFYDLMAEMSLCRLVDNYLCYVTDLLSLLFRSRPECLRSSETVTLDFVLGHKTTPRLIRAIADRQVNKLAYQGMKDLNDYTTKRLGLPLFIDDPDFVLAIEVVEMRNLIVHARGKVNEIFLSRTKSTQHEFGHQLSFSFASVRQRGNLLDRSVEDLEHRAHSKFGFAMPVPQ